MAYQLDPELEYFLGIGLPHKESSFLSAVRLQFEGKDHLSSPPHITIKRPFVYHFERPLLEQLEKWARRPQPFRAEFKKVATFKHKKGGTVYLAPDKAEAFKRLEQDLSKGIRFLPAETNFIPHLTIANRVPHHRLDEIKDQVRNLNLSFKFSIDNLTLFCHHRSEPWEVKQVFRFQI